MKIKKLIVGLNIGVLEFWDGMLPLIYSKNNKINKNWQFIIPSFHYSGSRISSVLMFLLFLSVPYFAQTNHVNWSSFSSGFGISNSGSTVITSSAGNSFTGTSANGSSSILSGFLTNYSILITDIEDDYKIIPAVYKLDQNYPNPFNPSTTIKYELPVEASITLNLYNILGEEVEKLVNTVQKAGTYEIKWNAADLPSGIYIYRIEAKGVNTQAGDFISMKKLILLK